MVKYGKEPEEIPKRSKKEGKLVYPDENVAKGTGLCWWCTDLSDRSSRNLCCGEMG